MGAKRERVRDRLGGRGEISTDGMVGDPAWHSLPFVLLSWGFSFRAVVGMVMMSTVGRTRGGRGGSGFDGGKLVTGTLGSQEVGYLGSEEWLEKSSNILT